MRSKFTAIIEKRGRWYVGYIEEIPGANTQGHTLKEVRENLKEALSLVLQANRELSQQRAARHKVFREPITVETP